MQFETITTNRWPGGRNSAGLPTSVRSDQLREILNFEYDSEDKLVTRLGYEKRSTGSLAGTFDTSKRVTSIHHYKLQSGTTFVILTNSNKVFLINPSTGDVTDINALTLPNDTLWMWKTFPVGTTGSAGNTESSIGVNRGTGANVNPVYIDDGSATKDLATAFSGSPPKGRFIEVWNNRVFIVDETNPIRLYWSRTGNGADFIAVANQPNTSPGFQDVGAKDGEAITGIRVHRQRLYIFKRTKCYMVIPGTPNTDFTLWKYEEISPTIGCVGQFTIQSVLNDLVFLSDYGVMSLSAVQQYGDVNAGLLSKDIKELREFNRNIDSFYSIVHPENSQYWLTIPGGLGSATNEEVHVLDFKRGFTPDLNRWTKSTGKVAATCYTTVRESGRDRVWIGKVGEVGRQKASDHADPFSDDANGYDQILQFRDQAILGDELEEKEFDVWGVSVKTLKGAIHMSITLKFDGDDTKSSSTPYTFERQETGSIWADDDAVLDTNELGSEGTYRNDSGGGGTGIFATEAPPDLDLVEAFGIPEGRVGQTLEMTLRSNTPGEGYALKAIMFRATKTQSRDVGDV